MNQAPNVFFISAATPAIKLQAICEIAFRHFEKKERLSFKAPDQAALEFVDLLLWRLPEESFLPHSASSSDLISIYTGEEPSDPGAIFNLCPLPCTSAAKAIYDFEDLSSPEKADLSKKRYLAYRSAGCPISSLQI